jgi:hypothetical protein
MSDWSIGDLAVCVDDSPPRNPVLSATTLLRLGGTYRVAPYRDQYLLVIGEPPHVVVGYTQKGGWDPLRFRKIRPDEHEACEPEFVTLLKRTKVRA